MKATPYILLFCLLNILGSETRAQLTSGPWVVGLGYNFVDDGGKRLGSIQVRDTWHSLAYPSRLSVEKILGYGLSLEAVGTMNQYRVGKIVNGRENPSLRNYYAFDIFVKYDLNNVIGETSWFDPFVIAGYGYTFLTAPNVSPGADYDKFATSSGTHNIGFGFNTWFTENYGLSFQTTGKWVLNKWASHHIQHSIGFVYKFGTEPKSTEGRSKYIKNYRKVNSKPATEHLRRIIEGNK